MKIKYLGHSAFLITSDAGVKIIADPYHTGSGFNYGEITESADFVTVSHEHLDHCNISAVKGNPQVISRTGRTAAKGIEIHSVASYHDEAEGRLRGDNTIFCFDVDGVKVCHLGDLGHLLDDKQLKEIGRVDVLLVPVGGLFTIDARVASEVCNQLKPRVIIPMHYRTEKSFPNIAGVDEFLKGKSNVSRPDSSELEFKAGGLPASTEIMVLKSAL